MKFETLTLHSVFVGCLLLCVLTLGAMLTSRPQVSQVAVAHAPAVAIRSAS